VWKDTQRREVSACIFHANLQVVFEATSTFTPPRPLIAAKTHVAELADGHEAVVGPVLDEQATLVGTVNLDEHDHVLCLQLPNALPEH